MTRDEIIDMACALLVYEPCSLAADAERRIDELFCAIAKKEREECAKLCDYIGSQYHDAISRKCADAIRSRGEK